MSPDPIIEITPSEAQYLQLARDLEALRTAGATSNTAAIVEAVHRAADNARTMNGKKKWPRGADTPGARSQGGNP